ncbi:myrosinase 1-like isoform X2 [Leptinotarsa decemlineata]|uniref:myrosinase 1-like isoform X2 n=1 Tax=Leptinotarsa decemlineata TaxID=7539 RepID=UPI003D3084D5
MNDSSVVIDSEKYHFPDGFIFGVASSAYQIEGGHDVGGKGQNIFDHYTKISPENFHGGSNGDITCDSYNRWRDDVKILKELGVDFYRFSISWSRILPEGLSNNVSEDGLRYYNNLIDELLKNGIEPMITMFHLDLPLPLERIGGLTNPYLSNYFEDYARILFENFGDRVKYWITFNGSTAGYDDDEFLPSSYNPATSVYLCIYVTILSHAKVYRLYEKMFRKIQKGKIGIVVDARWYEPGSTSDEDIQATERAREFAIGLFTNPIFHPDGDFPKIAKKFIQEESQREGYVRSKLPLLSPDEVEFIKGAFDFLGLNVYTSFLVKNENTNTSESSSWRKDAKIQLYQDESWPTSKSHWLKVEPNGARKVLKWIKEKYNNPDIFITENGFSDDGEMNDLKRIDYLQRYLKATLEAIVEDKVNVRGYAVWSLMDNFEWTAGYSEKFGLYHVDFADPDRKRTAKKSAEWYKNVMKKRSLVDL